MGINARRRTLEQVLFGILADYCTLERLEMTSRATLLALLFFAATPGWAAEPQARAVAFEPRNGSTLIAKCSRPGPGGVKAFWRVSEAEMSEVEARLLEFVDQRRKVSEFHSPLGLNQSLRRYLGLKLNSGERVIYVDVAPAHRPDSQFPPETFGISLCDGGPSYWGVEYLPESRTFRRLYFDGG